MSVSDYHLMASADRCTVFPRHRMVNQGRVEALCGNVYRCQCGKSALGDTDESKRRRGGRQGDA